MNQTIGRIAATTSPLAALLSISGSTAGAPNRQVGFTLRMDYTHATVMVHDHWRTVVGGIPINSYLIATGFDPADIAGADPIDQRVVLLRMVERTEIGTDREHLEAITQYFQNNPDTSRPDLSDFEVITRNRMSWSGARCHILGTFFADSEGKLRLGTDVEDMFATRQMRVHKPSPEALESIVNYVDPDREAKMIADAQAAGFGTPKAFPIGTVRFTSTRHMVGLSGETDVPVRVSPADFLARRTGVFGMTRTGKSNTTKTMVSEVALTSFETRRPIGQLIFDINGEYSNVNAQDESSAINDVFPEMTVRYRAMETLGFRELRSNFYDDLPSALELIGHAIEEQGRLANSSDFKEFLSLDLTEPDAGEFDLRNRWERRACIFRCILLATEYTPDAKNADRQSVVIGAKALAHLVELGIAQGHFPPDVIEDLGDTPDEKERAEFARTFYGLQATGKTGRHVASLEAFRRFWTDVRAIEREAGGYTGNNAGILKKKATKNGQGESWLDNTERAMLSMLVGRSSMNDNPIAGRQAIGAARGYHGPGGSERITRDIYTLLKDGRIVILDMSVGNPAIREKLAGTIVREIFRVSSNYFNQGRTPPSIAFYVEEAHNLIGKNADLTEIWPRIAKEGAKYGIALVYATQEPSSVHPNILANTENFFVTHLNNDAEIRALSAFYDFADFGPGLKRSQDVGFARIKTLSANFVTPTQITRFDPDTIKARYRAARALNGNDWFKPITAEEL